MSGVCPGGFQSGASSCGSPVTEPRRRAESQSTNSTAGSSSSRNSSFLALMSPKTTSTAGPCRKSSAAAKSRQIVSRCSHVGSGMPSREWRRSTNRCCTSRARVTDRPLMGSRAEWKNESGIRCTTRPSSAPPSRTARSGQAAIVSSRARSAGASWSRSAIRPSTSPGRGALPGWYSLNTSCPVASGSRRPGASYTTA
ncbi:hypothetical protein [Dactylosporangium darangshiense]|uniref:hypothetical protein n=1 Tax=Dactylosporangium darangshiense TaxID=579108 RepID=UPI00363844CE